MGLDEARVGAAIAVTDMARAIEFYEGKLGLELGLNDRFVDFFRSCWHAGHYNMAG